MRNQLLVGCAFVLLLGCGGDKSTSGDDDAVDSDPYSLHSMVRVPSGSFVMGSGAAYCGTSEHQVVLTSDFYFGKHEVTNQEYMAALQWAYDNSYVSVESDRVYDKLHSSNEILVLFGSVNSEMEFDGQGHFYLREAPSYEAQEAYPEGYDPADHPAKYVTWFGAARFCDWLSLQAGLSRAYEPSGDWACNNGDPYAAEGFRLPTDAEWEYAAQYDDERTYPWGDDPPDSSRANYGEETWSVGWTTPVGSYPDAPATLGLSDMAGNQYEWVNDWWECDLGTDPVTDPTGPAGGTVRGLRSCNAAGRASYLVCAHRGAAREPGSVSMDAGFRVARTAIP